MGNAHHLQGKLKALKLGGMLDSLELRLGQAQQGHLGYVEFLEMLMEDELQRRANKKLITRVTRARFEEVKTFEGFDFAFNPSIPAQQIKDLATCQFIERKEPVLICGPTGVGKSHLAQALGHAACRRGYDVLFTSAAKLLQQLNGGRADGSYDRRLQSFVRPDLLIIDDFGLKPLRPPAPEDFYDVINERYERGATLVTSNRALNEWPQLFGDPLLASAGLDRLFHNAHVLVITGDSFRARGRMLDSPAQPRP